MTSPTTLPRRPRVCLECGADMAGRPSDARHCRAACRSAFANRRKQRGAILYDLKMAERFERGHPDHDQLRTYIDRACAHWRDEDYRRQQKARPDIEPGWPSWGDAWEWIANNPWIKAAMSRTMTAALRDGPDRTPAIIRRLNADELADRLAREQKKAQARAARNRPAGQAD